MLSSFRQRSKKAARALFQAKVAVDRAGSDFQRRRGLPRDLGQFTIKIVVGEIFSGQQVAPSAFAIVDRTNKSIDDVADVDQVDSALEAEDRRFFREPRYRR